MHTVIQVVSLLAAALAAATGVMVWRRRALSPLALPLAVVLFGAAEWASARVGLTLADAHGLAVALSYAIFPGVATVVAGTFWYFLVLSGRRDLLTRRTAAWLSVHPILLAVVLPTDPWHRLFLRPSVDASGAFEIAAGPLYWVHTAYSYGLLTAGTVIVFGAMRRAVPGHRKVYAISIVAAIIPFAGNVITQALLASARGLHLTSVLFLVSAGIFFWVERYGRQSRQVPISARQVLGALSDAVVVVDPDGVLLDANPAAQVLLRPGRHEDRPEGRSGRGAGPAVRVVGAHWREVADPALADAFAGTDDVTLTTPDGTVLEVRTTAMTADGMPVGSVVVIRDVTELERLRGELAEQVVRDGLTGLHNRRHLDDVLPAAIEHAHRTGEPLSAVMVDVDHFKAVNDTYGHAAGDQVLAEVARTLVEGVRPGDTVVRFGGEEFLVLIPGVPAEAAARRAEVWRRRCGATQVVTDRGPVSVTVSAGVATLVPGGPADGLVRRADDALYRAKASGRDVVVLADDARSVPVGA